MTKEQAVDFLTTFYRLEVLSISAQYRATQNLAECIDGVADFLTSQSYKRGLYLMGMLGNGKTTMLKCIKKMYDYLAAEGYIEMTERNAGFVFVNAQELAMDIADNKERFQKCKQCDKLIIDDLGLDATEVPVYGISRHPLREVLMYRYEHRLVTIISSNLNATMMKEKYHDERLSDRMREMYETIVFKDSTFR